MAIVQAVKETPVLEPNEVNTRAVIGGNEPPVEERIAMEFREALLSERGDFEVKMAGAIGAVERAAVSDDETLGKAGDLDNILRACERHIEETHGEVKRPYLIAGRAVDAERKKLDGPLADARQRLKAKMNDYMAKREAERRAEQARIAAEQRAAEEAARAAEQRRIEAERAAEKAARDAQQAGDEAAAEAARLAKEEADKAMRDAERAMHSAAFAPTAAIKDGPVRSDTGATVSGTKVWHSEVEDFTKALKAVKSDPKVQDAIAAAVQRLVKAGQREIAGVRIWSTIEARAR